MQVEKAAQIGVLYKGVSWFFRGSFVVVVVVVVGELKRLFIVFSLLLPLCVAKVKNLSQNLPFHCIFPPPTR